MTHAALLTLIVTACSLAIPVVAAADESRGLYEPFPAAASKARAKHYIARLGPGVDGRSVETSDEALERGVYLADVPYRSAAAAGPASQRAGATASFGPSPAWTGAAVLLVLAALSAAGRSRSAVGT